LGDAWREHPSVQRLARVARALGPLNARLVFIGGAVAPILQTDPPFSSARVTKDVDAVAATGSASDHAALQEGLRAQGFREAMSEAHAHRWRAPDDSIFDLVPAGDHLGASGQLWDKIAIETATELQLEVDLAIRHANAPTFLALKWAAFRDRGATDPFNSHDLEDIIGVIASRPGIEDEVHVAPDAVRTFVREQMGWLAQHRDFEDLLAANLSRVIGGGAVARVTRERIEAMIENT
jgi:predicted nucleotidyltransferase